VLLSWPPSPCCARQGQRPGCSLAAAPASRVQNRAAKSQNAGYCFRQPGMH
jgi:hypothetical protein